MLKSDGFKAVKKNISKEMKSITLPEVFFAKMIRKVDDLLKIDVYTILLSTWLKSEELSTYLNKKNTSTEDVLIIPLADHAIKSVHAPSMKPLINDTAIGEIKFDVYIEFLVKGAILEIQNQKIKDLTIGVCEAKGSVGYDNFIFVEKEGEIPIQTNSINFGEGIPINEPVNKIHDSMEVILENQQKAVFV